MLILLIAAAGLGSAPSAAASVRTDRTHAILDPGQALAFAAQLVADGSLRPAETLYRQLVKDRDISVRSEARFRLALILHTLKRDREAAVELRRLVDEQPDAANARIGLAQLLDEMGDVDGARRQLRAAQSGDLPPEVVRFLDRYSAALRARKPFGASFEMAIAPDTNINRATRSDTLGTVIGDFTLDENAKQKSGIGVALRGQAYGRVQLSEKASLLGRASSSADIYRDKDFNDLAIGLSAGPEFRLGSDRLAVEAGVLRRTFGGKPLAMTATLGGSYLHPLDRVAQLRVSASVGRIDHKLNPLQGGTSYAVSVGYERALSPTTGVGASIALDRQALRDPGYATKGGQFSLFGYREFGAMTLLASLGHGRLSADERLFIYPERRRDRLYRASLGATFRQLELGGLAPFVRVTREINSSSIEIFDYRRTRTEFGFTRAF